MSNETHVREFLQRMADEADVPAPDWRPPVKRARRRRMVTIAIAAMAVLAMVSAGSVAWRSFGETALRPAKQNKHMVPAPRYGVAFSADYVTGPTRPTSRTTRHDIYLSLPGQRARRIVGSDSDGIDQSCPRFSPDGTELAYRTGPVGAVSGGSEGLEVVRVDPGGTPSGPPTQLAYDPRRELYGCPQWSPDGKQLAMVEDGRGMVIASPHGRSHTIGLSFFHGYGGGERLFAWSPDSSKVALVNRRTMYLVPVDGGRVRALWVNPAGLGTQAIAWSPDGSQLAVGGNAGDDAFLTIVDPKSGKQSSVSSAGRAGEYVVGLAWLPGDRLLVDYSKDGFVLVDPTGVRRPVAIHLEYMPIGNFDVSPDGQWLVYVALGAKGYAVVSAPIEGGGKPIFYTPWTYGVEYAGDVGWQTTPR